MADLSAIETQTIGDASAVTGQFHQFPRVFKGLVLRGVGQNDFRKTAGVDFTDTAVAIEPRSRRTRA